jgi:hypothetical protein
MMVQDYKPMQQDSFLVIYAQNSLLMIKYVVHALKC